MTNRQHRLWTDIMDEAYHLKATARTAEGIEAGWQVIAACRRRRPQ